MGRPTVWVSILFLLGTFAAALDWIPGFIAPAGIFAVGVAIASAGRGKPARVVVGLFLAVVAAGAFGWNARHVRHGDALGRFVASQPDLTVLTVEGTVERADILLPGSSYLQFQMRARSLSINGETRPTNGGVLVRWSEPTFSPLVGERVRVTAPATVYLGRVNPGIRSIEEHYHRHGIFSAMSVRGADNVTRTGEASLWSPFHWASRLRNAQARRLMRAVPEKSLPFVLTVWLGERRTIDDDTYLSFVESGTAHILAVSGVHTGVVYVTLMVVMRLLFGNRNRHLQTIAIMGAVLLFALTAGARVSSMRAAVMIALYLLAELFDREPDAPSALSIAAFLFTVHNPDVLFDAGFQLSFLCISSILLFSEPIQLRLLKVMPNTLGVAVASTLSVQLLVLPVAVSQFYVLPILAPLANLLVVPLLSVVLWLCLLTSTLSFLVPAVAPLFGHAIDPFVFLIALIANVTAGFEMSHVYLTKPSTVALISYWLAIAFVTYSFHDRRRRRFFLAAGAASALATVLCWNPIWPQPEVTFLDVGKGDATFIRTAENGTLLVDGGEKNRFFSMGRGVVAPYLWSNHVTHIDAIVATHPDSDHIGGLLYVLDKFSVGAVYLGPVRSGDALENELLVRCDALEVPIRRIARGSSIHIPGAEVEVLHPRGEGGGSLSDNDRSVVLRVTLEGTRVLLTGDVEQRGEAEIARNDCAAEIVKVPHHGSRTSSTLRFLDAVQAKHAVFSTGKHRGRPIMSPKVLDRYEQSGASIYRTDWQGGIRFRFESEGMLIDTGRKPW